MLHFRAQSSGHIENELRAYKYNPDELEALLQTKSYL